MAGLAINTGGEVVGSYELGTYPDNPSHAFVWDPTNGIRDLGTLGGTSSVAEAVSDTGSVIGRSDTNALSGHAVRWDPVSGSTTRDVPASLDTYVNRSAPASHFGTASSLAADAGETTLMRFTVPAAPAGRTLVAATLRLRSTSGAGAGSAATEQVHRSSHGWNDFTTWSTRPSIDPTVLGVLGPVVASAPVSAHLDPAAVAPGTLDLAVTGSSSDAVWLWSRDYARAAYRPMLELTYR